MKKAIKILKAIRAVKRKSNEHKKSREIYIQYIQSFLTQFGYYNFRMRDYNKAHKFLTQKYNISFGVEKKNDVYWAVMKSIPHKHIKDVRFGVFQNRHDAMLNILGLICENI